MIRRLAITVAAMLAASGGGVQAKTHIIPKPPTFDYAAHRALVARYIAASAAADAKGLVATMTADVQVRDFTFAVLAGKPLILSGRKALYNWYAPLTAFARKATETVEDEVYAGDYAVVRHTSVVDTVGAQAGRPDLASIVLSYKTTSIFQFRAGRIARITDYVDYEAVKQQIAAAH